ncbi:MAG: hypothetical protein KXJ49_01625, partial [Vulcanococcus sp.]|uniref:hypothetical protein n=1 Tax=Vulcanococcus sp. TaxID=2856995 RepID=UPI0025D079B3
MSSGVDPLDQTSNTVGSDPLEGAIDSPTKPQETSLTAETSGADSELTRSLSSVESQEALLAQNTGPLYNDFAILGDINTELALAPEGFAADLASVNTYLESPVVDDSINSRNNTSTDTLQEEPTPLTKKADSGNLSNQVGETEPAPGANETYLPDTEASEATESSAVNTITINTTVLEPALDLLVQARLDLRTAQASGTIQEAINISFDKDNIDLALTNLNQFLNGKAAPAIHWAQFSEEGVNGAFIPSNATILISQDIKNDAALVNLTTLEEIGHWLEHNAAADSRGDEGEIFSSIILLNTKALTTGLEKAVLVIGEQEYLAELSTESSTTNDEPFLASGTIANLVIDEDTAPISLGLDDVVYSPGVGESNQSLTYTITSLPDSALGTITLADGTPIQAGRNYSIEQINGLKFDAAANAFGQSSLTFQVTDSGTAQDGTAGSAFSIYLGEQSILEAELNTLKDLDSDGITALTLTTELVGQQPWGTSSDNRYAYTDSSGAVVITSTRLTTQWDPTTNANIYTLSNLNNNQNAITDGPAALTLTAANDNPFTVPAGSTVAGVRLTQYATPNGGTEANEYELFARKNQTNEVVLYRFSLAGNQLNNTYASGVATRGVTPNASYEFYGFELISSIDTDSAIRETFRNKQAVDLTFNITSVENGTIVRPDSQTFVLTPDTGFIGDINIAYTVSDPQNPASSRNGKIVVSVETQDGSIRALSADQIRKIEVQSRFDLTGDGTVGVQVNSELFNPQSQGGYSSWESQTRYLYQTNSGILISRDSVPTGNDLRNASSGNNNNPSEGPSYTLVSYSDLNLAASESVIGVRRQITLAEGTNTTINSGFELILRDSTAPAGQVRGVATNNTGDVYDSYTLNPGDLTLRALEIATRLDLNGNSTVAGTIQSELVGPGTNDTTRRVSQTTDGALLISREGLAGMGSDLRTIPANTTRFDGWSGPGVAILATADGNAPLTLNTGESVLGARVTRDTLPDGM